MEQTYEGEEFKEKLVEKTHQKMIFTAWMTMIVASSLALIFWREFANGEPAWWPWIHLGLLLIIFTITLLLKSLRSLWIFVGILILIFIMGFGGGWQFGVVPYIRNSEIWVNWTSNLSWGIESIATHLLRLLPAIAILIFLLIIGRTRKDLYLVKGTINAPAQPTKILGMKEPEPWTKLGRTFVIVITIGMLIFLIIAYQPTLEMFIAALPLIPIAFLIAAMNAFNEEFTLRAAPLSELNKNLGRKQALIITTVFFGLGHYFGIPNGIIGVLLSGFLGWFLGKSILETKGFFWAWFIHFVQDVLIFSFLAMASVF